MLTENARLRETVHSKSDAIRRQFEDADQAVTTKAMNEAGDDLVTLTHGPVHAMTFRRVYRDEAMGVTVMIWRQETGPFGPVRPESAFTFHVLRGRYRVRYADGVEQEFSTGDVGVTRPVDATGEVLEPIVVISMHADP